MLACQKSLFSLPPELHYLNCAFMAPLAQRVEAAGLAGLRRWRAPSQIAPQDFFEDGDRVRSLFARLINADDPQRVAIIPAASYGLATVARNTSLRSGQNVVVLHEQFPSNVYTWRRLCRERDAELRTVTPPDGTAQRAARWNERVLEAIDTHTALVALPHIHWADGTLFDLEEIGARVRAVGAALVVDGTQSVGALPFDVARVRPDALVCAGYKWLLGPYGLSLAYYGPRYDDGLPLEDNWISRRDSENFGGLVRYEDAYQPGALRYDVGERSHFILLPMLRESLTLVLEWGPENVQPTCRALTEKLAATARNLDFWMEEPAGRAAHLFGLRLPAAVTQEQMAAALTAQNVSVSVRGAALRIAPHVYNNAEDLDALAAALHDAVR